jgi:hypothetical protein
MRVLLNRTGFNWHRLGMDDKTFATSIAVAGMSDDHVRELQGALVKDVSAMRSLEHEGHHYKQNLSLPYCIYAASALRYCMASLRSALQHAYISGELDGHQISIPLFRNKHLFAEAPGLGHCVRNIQRIYESWMVVDGAMAASAWWDLLTTPGSASNSDAVDDCRGLLESGGGNIINPLGARALIEGSARISEIFWIGYLSEGKEYIGRALESELIEGEDIYGATLRLVARTTGLDAVKAACLVCEMADIALVVDRPLEWPSALVHRDDRLTTVPGLRFAMLLRSFIQGELALDHHALGSPSGYRELEQAVQHRLGWAKGLRGAENCKSHVRQTQAIAGFTSFSASKYHLMEAGLDMRSRGSAFVFALPWHSESVHLRRHWKLDSPRTWFQDGTILGPEITTIDTIQEMWDIAWYSWYERIVETRGLFGPRPVLAVDNFLCCRREGECSSLLRGDEGCKWVRLFEEFIGIPPRCFSESDETLSPPPG